jgi:hypothetical protein
MDGLMGVILLAIIFVFYFLPTLICCGRKNCRCGTAIFALNLLLGWTLLGWVVALVWSLIPDREVTSTHA